MSRHDRSWRDLHPEERELAFWGAVVQVSQFMVAMLCLYAVVLMVGAVIAAFTPGQGHGF